MACAGLAFYLQSIPLLIGLLFFMGTQSALFGPVKYSLLPQTLKDYELVGGNALVSFGTFVAILIGLIAGVLITSIENTGIYWLSLAVLMTVHWKVAELARAGAPSSRTVTLTR